MSRQSGQDSTPDTTPLVSGSQVFAAGLASTGAAFVTSTFGVAGTILGAALTAMIITGGAAILKVYFESVTGNIRKVPQRLRARRERRKAARYAEPSVEPIKTLPDRPDLRDNFMGRLRAAIGFFSRLPLPARRSVLVKGLIGAVLAFGISMGAIYVVERGIGNSLSCGLWGACPEGATPGIHLGGGDGTGAGSTIGGARASQSGGAVDRNGGVLGSDQQGSPLQQQDPASQQPGGGNQVPAPQQTPSGGQNVAPGGSEAGQPAAPVEPAEPAVPSEEPAPGQPIPQQQAPSE